MATIATQKLDITTGSKATLAAASTSDDYPCGPGYFACISIGATATTVTLVDPRTLSTGQAAPDVAYGPFSNTELWIPLNNRALAGSNGKVNITMDQAANVTCAAVYVE